ncbi:MAG TPA: hypothetical protein VNK49_08310 [Anaerolineales bacterium]|nr:hypothetical protein [Anaerolineales bacterium]
MEVNRIENDPELQKVLWACYEYWQREILPPENRAICYSWVVRLYQDRFGARFHQSKLRHLAKLGFLQEDDTARDRQRRYYKLKEPDRLAELLQRWNLL